VIDPDLQVDSVRPIWAEFDYSAIASNLTAIRHCLRPGTHIIASVKGNAYGHGVERVARSLEDAGVDMLATGSFAEALELRAAGLGVPLLLFGGARPEGLAQLFDADMIATIHNHALAKATLSFERKARVFVKVDAGLGRLGVNLDDAFALISELQRARHVELLGVYTHLPFGDREGKCWASARAQRFERLVGELASAGIVPPYVQTLASSGVLGGLEEPGNTICPGHSLYGIGAENSRTFRPVLQAIRANLIQVYRTDRTTTLGSGGKLVIPPNTTVGVVPVGLADGYRSVPNLDQVVLHRGARAKVLAVNLEHTLINLDQAEHVLDGETVTLLGADRDDQITIDELAAWRGTSSHEVMMSFSGRLPVKSW
jgi:alanine racemase